MNVEEEDDDVEEDDVEEEDRSQDREAHFVRACAVEIHMNIAQELLSRNLQGKYRPLIPGSTPCASLRSRNAYGHVTGGISCGNLQRACAVEMHMDMSEEAFCAEI